MGRLFGVQQTSRVIKNYPVYVLSGGQLELLVGVHPIGILAFKGVRVRVHDGLHENLSTHRRVVHGLGDNAIEGIALFGLSLIHI